MSIRTGHSRCKRLGGPRPSRYRSAQHPVRSQRSSHSQCCPGQGMIGRKGRTLSVACVGQTERFLVYIYLLLAIYCHYLFANTYLFTRIDKYLCLVRLVLGLEFLREGFGIFNIRHDVQPSPGSGDYRSGVIERGRRRREYV